MVARNTRKTCQLDNDRPMPREIEVSGGLSANSDRAARVKSVRDETFAFILVADPLGDDNFNFGIRLESMFP